jgi:broad specificity phosphatase PhoE
MAQVVANSLAKNDITYVVASPLERAQQTATPIAKIHNLQLATDHNLIESENVFEGQRVSVGDGVLRKPRTWRHLWNPFRPSWGEPYVDVAARMRLAIEDARKNALGHEAVCVSHQLPIWVARLDAEKRSFLHDPRRRQCSLASLTSFVFEDDKLISVQYSEPAAELVERSTKGVGA